MNRRSQCKKGKVIMAAKPPEAPLVFSTETDRARRKAIANFALVCLMPAFFVIAFQLAPDMPDNWEEVGLLLFFEASFVALGLCCTFHPHRGSWHLDDVGIHFFPLHGKPRSIAWHEVERVMWTPSYAILKGSGKKLGLPSAFVDDKSFLAAAHARIEKQLSADFDLMLKPPAPDFTQIGIKKGLIRFAQLCWIGVVAFVVLSIGTAALVFILSLVISNGMAIFLLLSVAYLVSTGLFVHRECRRHEHINPTWRNRRFD
jgi:hypothetical protein